MTNLDKDRKTPELLIFDAISPLEYDVAASAKLFAGGFGMLDASGNLVRGAADTSLTMVGVVEKQADNSSGDAGDIRARVKPGVYRMENGGASIATANINSVCYVGDDNTVYLTDGSATRPKAGVIVNVDDVGVWVAVGFSLFSNPAATPSGTLQKKTVTIGQADLTDAVNGEAQAINIDTALPANAIVVAALITLTTQFTGGSASAVAMDIGWSGATEAVVKDFDAFGATAGAEYTQGATSVHQPVVGNAKQLIATFTPDGGHTLLALTAGALTIDVFYFVAF